MRRGKDAKVEGVYVLDKSGPGSGEGESGSALGACRIEV